MKTQVSKLEQLAKTDNKVMSLLTTQGVKEVRHPLLHTDKGELTLKLEKGGSALDYVLVLDAVQFGDKENKELLKELAPLIENL